MNSIYGRNDIFRCDKESKEYPDSLKKISNGPSVLFYRGKIEIIDQYKNIAVIGSRKASDAGMRLSYDTGKLLGKRGINLVNGLALGCDTEALKGALSVGGRCVAILPCGLEQIQPRSNQWLADEILEKGGCLLSEYPVGTKLQKYNYVERDRLQSGISQGVLVVEAMEDSGTMHTANFAKKQAKRLACYYHRLLGTASGNKYLEESRKADVLKTMEDTQDFINRIMEEPEYEQIAFDFLFDNSEK